MNKFKKLWIKQRLIIGLSIFLIFIVNLFLFWLYFLVIKNTQKVIYSNIIDKYSTIKTFIDLQENTNFLQIPNYEIEKINNLWFFLYIGKNDKLIKSKFNPGITISDKNIIFRWDYKWYNIVIWKNTNELKIIKNDFLKIIIILNLILIFIIILFLNYFTNFLIKPLINLSNFLNNYNLEKDKKIIKNYYWNTEIGLLTKAINNFIKQAKNILDSQNFFIQDVNHELKTPLMQINSNIELIEEKIKDEKIINKIKQIKKSTENINEILTNLWFILKWEKLDLYTQEINLNKFFDELIEKYQEKANKKNIKINLISKEIIIIKNNKYYLNRLFWNILLNAIIYNNWNNEIKIEVNKNEVKICDKWIWIEKKEINKIFNRFYRNKNSWIYYKQGSWLWLAIVKKICDLFGWKIEIKSKIWEWSCFTVKIK